MGHRKQRLARLRLLSAELESLRVAALERTKTNDTKASFLVVAAGFLAAVTGAELLSAETHFLGFVPLSLTLATVIVLAPFGRAGWQCLPLQRWSRHIWTRIWRPPIWRTTSLK